MPARPHPFLLLPLLCASCVHFAYPGMATSSAEVYASAQVAPSAAEALALTTIARCLSIDGKQDPAALDAALVKQRGAIEGAIRFAQNDLDLASLDRQVADLTSAVEQVTAAMEVNRDETSTPRLSKTACPW